ncbi:SIR2 family protein [Bacillus sp. DE0042]|uniref:SIR2 family protein n=1 Tax=Bacillus sp. DE0042 TaxID=2584950 RepID=UPI00119DF771|nr:SIR2 family protein [Bacillus sp. DE0042]
MTVELNINKYEKNLEIVLPDLIKSYNEESLIFFIGAGCSRIQGYPNWDEYIGELISYWESNLGEIIDENSYYTKVEEQDIKILENLQKSNIEKKRKIDIAHQLIEKYCRQKGSNFENMEKRSKEKFNKNVLNYEKVKFMDWEPKMKINPVLQELVKLECLFITTNYDNQIEKHSEFKGRNISIYKKVDEVPAFPKVFSVIHLHGTPEIDKPIHFINSSSSYSHLYLDNQSELQNIINLLRKKKNISIIFIGCSMDEEEVLTLLDRTENSKANYYAFLSDRSDVPSNNREIFQNVEEEFFREKRNINVIRYGEDYTKLPSFIDSFVDKLVQKTKRDTENDWNTLFDNADINIIDNYISKENYYFLNRFYKQALENNQKEKTREILTASFNSQLIKNNEIVNAHKYSDFWTFLSVNFSELESEEKKVVMELINKVTGYNNQNNMDFFNIINKYYYVERYEGSIEEKLTVLKLIFSWGLNEKIIDKIQNNEIYLFWILFILSENTSVYREKLAISKVPTINFNNVELEAKIIQLVQNIQGYSPIEDSLEYNQGAQLFSLILKERKLNLDSLTNDSFYKVKFVQKLFVYLDNKEIRYPGVIEKVIKEIDYADQFFGSELNLFLKNHPEISAQNNTLAEYKDGISSVQVSNVVDKPFIETKDLLKWPIGNIIETLKTSRISQKQVNPHTLYIFNVEGQNEELISFFEKDPAKGEKIVGELLQNEDLKSLYLQAISVYLQNHPDSEGMIHKYIDVIEKDKITYETYKIFRSLIKVNPELVYEFLTHLDYSSFEQKFIEGVPDEQFIEINYFSNSNIGKFYEILRECMSNKAIEKERLNSYIEQTRNTFLKQYVCGMFYEFAPTEISKVTFNSFQGISHYNNIRRDVMPFYKNIVINLLLNGTKDSFLQQNIILVIIYEVIPKTDIDVSKVNKDLLSEILPGLFRAYLQSQDFNENTYKWLLEILKNTELSSTLMEFIITSCKNSNNETLKRIDKLLIEIENNKFNPNKSIRLSLVNHYVKEVFNNTLMLRKEKINVYIKAVILSFKNNFIKIDDYSYEEIDDLMNVIDEEGLFEKNKELHDNIQNYLPAVDFNKLGRKYLRV